MLNILPGVNNLWWEYRKEKLTASNFYIATVNKVEPRKKMSFFYSSVKTSSMKHGIVNEGVAFNRTCIFIDNSVSYVTFDLILSKLHLSWSIT